MKSFPLLLIAACVAVFASCSSSVYREVYPTLMDGRYDSEFPYKGCSTQLEEISETVKRVTVVCNYKTYSFSREDSIKISDINQDLLNRRETAYQHRSSAGTGIVVYNEGGRIALITCSHVVDFADTTINRYMGSDFRMSPYVRSIAVKINQLTFLNEIGGGIALDILANDPESDLAILGQKIEPQQRALVHVFQYPLGRAKDLEWGSFVYLFGYPAGYRMVTKGIVSLPDRVQKGSFVVDAVIAPGSSGSIALAIRDGVPNFELVGMIKMIPAQSSYLLTPSTEGDIEYDPIEPYHGDVFVLRKAEIQQGIAVAIPTETIVAFVERNRRALEEKGFYLNSWIHPPKKELEIH